MAKNINDLRVAMVMNDHQVVLNAGSDDGVNIGYSYVVYEDGPQVTDPVTGDDLGNLQIVKGRVWVHNLSSAHCIAGDNPDAKVSIANSRSFASRLALLDQPSGLGNVKVGDHCKRIA